MDALIRRVIIPVDFSAASEAAARFGCRLARNLGAHVYLIHVIDDPVLIDRKSRDPDQLYRDARTHLTAVAHHLDHGRGLTTEVRVGNVAENIAAAVTAYGADLVVMATHGRTGLPHVLFGSVAEDVIRAVSCPVMVMRESGKVKVHQAATERAALAEEEQLCSLAH